MLLWYGNALVFNGVACRTGVWLDCDNEYAIDMFSA